MRLAARLGMSLDRVKMETSCSQFVLWMEFMDWELDAVDKQCAYLAQIAAEIRRSYVKNYRSVKIADFLLKFNAGKDKAVSTGKQALANAKSMFFQLTGLSGPKTGKGRKP